MAVQSNITLPIVGPDVPRIILGVTGSVAAIKTLPIAVGLKNKGTQVVVVATSCALEFIDRAANYSTVKQQDSSLPSSVIAEGIPLFTDKQEWSSWNKLGDSVLHIELRKWADAIIIAPLSANTLAKLSNGICDNLLTSIGRAWDFERPFIVAPAMNTLMWKHPFTDAQLKVLKNLGVTVVPPQSKKLACGDIGEGGLAEVSTIIEAVLKAVAIKRRASL